jgi:hypothetical protein
MLSSAMLMSKMARVELSIQGQGLGVFDVACLRDHPVAEFFHHLGRHHSDEGFVFHQKYVADDEVGTKQPFSPGDDFGLARPSYHRWTLQRRFQLFRAGNRC